MHDHREGRKDECDMITWFQVYKANFGRDIDADDQAAWEAEIQTRIRNLQQGETVAAIRDIAETDRKGQRASKFAPTVNDIISGIIRLRAKARAERDGTAMPVQADMAAAKHRIRNAHSLDDIYREIQTRPDDERLVLAEFAASVYGDTFRQPIMPTYEQCARRAAESGETLAAAHAKLWQELNAPLESAFAASETRR